MLCLSWTTADVKPTPSTRQFLHLGNEGLNYQSEIFIQFYTSQFLTKTGTTGIYTINKPRPNCISSLHNIIFNVFRIVLVLWSLLVQTELSTFYVIVVQKKVKVEIESSHCVGGAMLLTLQWELYLLK